MGYEGGHGERSGRAAGLAQGPAGAGHAPQLVGLRLNVGERPLHEGGHVGLGRVALYLVTAQAQRQHCSSTEGRAGRAECVARRLATRLEQRQQQPVTAGHSRTPQQSADSGRNSCTPISVKRHST